MGGTVRIAGVGVGWIVGLCLGAAGLAFPAGSDAAKIRPDATSDRPGAPDDGKCRLREAIIAANTDSRVDGCPAGDGKDLIILRNRTYEIDGSGPAEDQAAAGDLDISGPLRITTTAGTAKIQGDGGDRIFQITNARNVTFEDVAIKGGNASGAGGGIFIHNTKVTLKGGAVSQNEAGGAGGGISLQSGRLIATDTKLAGNNAFNGGGIQIQPGARADLIGTNMRTNTAVGSGGAILNDGTLLVARQGLSNQIGSLARFTGNVAGVLGGAIATDTASLTIINGAIAANNSAEQEGGAIHHAGSGTLRVLGTLFRNNDSGIGGSGVGSGGAIYATGSLDLIKSSFVGNFAGNEGGGIFSSDQLILDSTTLWANEAEGNGSNGGGGVQLRGSAMATVLFSTIAANTAEYGGGLHLGDSSTLQVWSTLFADNVATEGLTGHECGGPGDVQSNGHNVVENAAGCIAPGSGDQLGVDAKTRGWDQGMYLGGVRIARNSPARDAGGAPARIAAKDSAPTYRGGLIPVTDMRAVPRSGSPDVGALEFITCFGREPTIIGTALGDRITGTAGPDVVLALDGNDNVETRSGADRVCTGKGRDTARGGGGKDRLDGGPGNRDRMFGDGGRDQLRGGEGGPDRCDGGAGRDSGHHSCEREFSIP